MGIRGFFQLFKSKLKIINLEDLKGRRVGVDGHIWLHRSVYAGMELAINKDGNKFVNYFKKCVERLTKNGITPVIVFDGDRLPIKSKEESKRRVAARLKIEKGKLLLEAGDKKKGYKVLTESISITFEMIRKVIVMLKEKNIEYYVSPYESDAQLAYLDKIGLVDYVLSEDTDLCAYGVRHFLCKFDASSNSCHMLITAEIINEFKSYDQFLEFCILCGCDFYKMSGVGVHRAKTLIDKWGSYICIPRPRQEYQDRQFFAAKYTFLNQVVYCPKKKKMVFLGNVRTKIELDGDRKKIERKFYNEIESNYFMMCFSVGVIRDDDTTGILVTGDLNPSALPPISKTFK